MCCAPFLMRCMWWTWWIQAIQLIWLWWSVRTWGWRSPNCTAGRSRSTASVCSWTLTHWWERDLLTAQKPHSIGSFFCSDVKTQWTSKILSFSNLSRFHKWFLIHLYLCIQVLSNIDELFEREELSAAPDPGWPDCFNSGVFVFRPSNETHEKLITFCGENGSFDGKWICVNTSKHNIVYSEK